MVTPVDRLEINELISRYFRTLQERSFEGDWSSAYFTEDIRVESPHGTAHGPDAVKQSREVVEDWAAIQYLNTDILIDIDDADPDQGTASWNGLMTHTHHEAELASRGEGLDPLFTVGGVWNVDLRRTSGGWRFSRTAVQPIWMSGTAPAFLAAAE